MKEIEIFPLQTNLETKKILKKSIQANRALLKLNGVAQIIPNQNILNSSVLQEAKDVQLNSQIGMARLATLDFCSALCNTSTNILPHLFTMCQRRSASK